MGIFFSKPALGVSLDASLLYNNYFIKFKKCRTECRTNLYILFHLSLVGVRGMSFSSQGWAEDFGQGWTHVLALLPGCLFNVFDRLIELGFSFPPPVPLWVWEGGWKKMLISLKISVVTTYCLLKWGCLWRFAFGCAYLRAQQREHKINIITSWNLHQCLGLFDCQTKSPNLKDIKSTCTRAENARL